MASLKSSRTSPRPPPLRSLLFHALHSSSPRPRTARFKSVSRSHPNAVASIFLGPKKSKVLSSAERPTAGGGRGGAVAFSSRSDDRESSSDEAQSRRPFDVNLAVVLAGFAFEAYTSPPDNVGWHEIDTASCQTVILSEKFLHEVYDGQLFVKLKKGVDLPALDPWGTSDPYVVLQLEGQVAKSKVKWASKEPVWDENFALNFKVVPGKALQVAAWDANLVTPHKRMGNGSVNLDSLCDGNLHELVVELEGLGGGGKIHLEVKYKSYEEIEEEKQWWRIPFVSEILMKSSLGGALKTVLGSESINVTQFVESAFGQLATFNFAYLQKPFMPNSNVDNSKLLGNSTSAATASDKVLPEARSLESRINDSNPENGNNLLINPENQNNVSPQKLINDSNPENVSNEYFWKAFADVISQSIPQKFAFSIPELKLWDGLNILNKMSSESRRVAEEEYVKSGLATPEKVDDSSSTEERNGIPLPTNGTELSLNSNVEKDDLLSTGNGIDFSLLDVKRVSRDVLSQTETILGALMVLTSTLSEQTQGFPSLFENRSMTDTSKAEEQTQYSSDQLGTVTSEGSKEDAQKAEEMRKLFSSAEGAMEAWAMLATSLGRTSFIKSDFEKICFLDNTSTDTQVAIWRDQIRKRLVVAFRGTEQARWKDLRTDLMLLPAGLNPERLGGDFKQEVQVHSGFLNAYDSVRNRIMMLIQIAIGCHIRDEVKDMHKWQVYVTGHSLGGALATLLALELSTSRMAKHGIIDITMYNFGSPRVGNRRFVDVYNEKVKDSWRVVNHRDIIPTVPRLMGYCHVAQPVYLSAGDFRDTLANREFLNDGYQIDIIGEATPDVLVNEFFKGEKQLVEQILQTEINLLRSLRDGTALMQHMEDFYYVTLLESVRRNYTHVDASNPTDEDYFTA